MTRTPTETAHGAPTTCHVCSRHAIGIGIGEAGKEPKYLCAECVQLLEQIKRVRRFDPYELQALDGAVDAVGDYIDSINGKSELSEYDETERRMLCKAAVQGFGDELRRVIAQGEAPF